jgi:phenylacetate-CoA ligase
LTSALSQTLYRRAVIQGYEGLLRRRKTYAYWQRLERTQWLDHAALEKIQIAALRDLLRHAKQTCAYYRDAWECAGLDPDRVTSLSDFHRFPRVDRDVITEHRDRMRSTAPGIVTIPKATGGSSGVPLHFDVTRDSNERRAGTWHRGYSWAGAGPGTRQLYLWGGPLGQRPWRSRAKDVLWDALYRRRVLNSFEYGEERALDFARQISRYRPDAVVAYVNPLYAMARVLREKGVRPVGPKSIVVGAEKLHDFQRDIIESVFGCPVFETYGCREFSLMAAECDRHQGLHMTMEQLVVEVLRDDGSPCEPGEEGDIVVTDLYNYGMPFVRYMNGDRAVRSARVCGCGRGLPLLERVAGRRVDILSLPGGRTVAGELFPHLIKDYAGVRRFQVVQDSTTAVDVRLVTTPELDSISRARLEESVRRVLGEGVNVSFSDVPDIPLTRLGKYRVVVNRTLTPAATPAPSPGPSGG